MSVYPLSATYSLTDMPATGYPVTGYGSDVPTPYMVKCTDGRTRRVYGAYYGNQSFHYIKTGNLIRPLSPETEELCNRARANQ